jgi:hypothetical protein
LVSMAEWLPIVHQSNPWWWQIIHNIAFMRWFLIFWH